jgi:hypothetical protein
MILTLHFFHLDQSPCRANAFYLHVCQRRQQHVKSIKIARRT